MNFLREGDIKRITTEYNKAKQTLVDAGEQTEDKLSELVDAVTVDKYLRVVDIAEIKQNDFNLNISRYIDMSEDEEIIDIKQSLKSIKLIDEKLFATDRELKTMLASIGLEE